MAASQEERVERAMKKLGIEDDTPLDDICDVVTRMFAYGGVAYMSSDWREHTHLTRRQAGRLFEGYFRGFQGFKNFGTGPGGIERYGCSRFKVHYYHPELRAAFDLVSKTGVAPSRLAGARAKVRFFKDLKITYIPLPYSKLYEMVVERVRKIIKNKELNSNKAVLSYFIGDAPIEPMEEMGQIFGTIFGDLFDNIFETKPTVRKEEATI